MQFILELLDNFCLILFVVGLIHLFVPTIIALTNKKFKRKTLKIITLINALTIVAVQSAIFIPWIFSVDGLIGLGFFIIAACGWSFAAFAILKRGSRLDMPYMRNDSRRIVECKNCGYKNKKFFTSCPKCGKYSKRYIYLDDESTIVDNE